MNTGKPDSAIEYLEKSLSIRRYKIGMVNLAMAYEESGDKANAVKYYKKFISRTKPGDPGHALAKNRISSIKQETE